MTIFVEVAGRSYRLGSSHDISIPLDFRGPQPNAYGVPSASAKSFEYGDTNLSVASGGSCNCDVVTLTPHCNGTHTECIGHIQRDPQAINAIDLPAYIPATLITVEPEGRAISASEIEKWKYDVHFREALVIRTMPNDKSKTTRAWQNETTPFLTIEAMQAIRGLGVQHLLIDLPSVDPLHDGGALAAHRVFWNMPSAERRTITEMIYVPEGIPDGRYVLSLQVLNWHLDAAPSRPILHSIELQI